MIKNINAQLTDKGYILLKVILDALLNAIFKDLKTTKFQLCE